MARLVENMSVDVGRERFSLSFEGAITLPSRPDRGGLLSGPWVDIFASVLRCRLNMYVSAILGNFGRSG